MTNANCKNFELTINSNAGFTEFLQQGVDCQRLK